MNNNFFDSSSYYLIDVFNGEEKKSKIKLNIVNNSKYNLLNTKEVQIESKTKEVDKLTGEEYYNKVYYQAFVKSSLDTTRDSLDILNSEIAQLLDIPCSNVYKILNEENLSGVLNLSVKSSVEEQINIDILINKLIKLVKEKNIKITSWLKDYFSLPKTDVNMMLNNEDHIASVIEISINTIAILFRLTTKEIETLKSSYLQMIFFDLLSNNSNRNFNTYSIITNKDMKYKCLAPIYDYNNDFETKSYYLLNNQYIDKSAIISCMYHKYYPYIKKISKGLLNNKSIYLESINLIIENNIESAYIDIEIGSFFVYFAIDFERDALYN